MRALKNAASRLSRTTSNLVARVSAVPPPIWALRTVAALSIVCGSYWFATARPVLGGVNLVYGLFLIYTIRRK